MRVSSIVLVLSTALCLTACNRSKIAEPPFTEAQEKRLRELLRQEIAAAKVPPGTVATDSQKIRDEVDKLILARIREEVPKVEWQDKLKDPKVLALLSTGSPEKKKDPYDAQDLNGIPTLKGKIEAAVKGLEGHNTYRSNTELSDQLRNLGPGTKEALWEVMNDPHLQRNGAGSYVIFEALSSMLTVDDKDLIIKDLKSKTPRLFEIAQKLHIEEAGPVALQRLEESTANPQVHVDYRMALMAMESDQDKAAPLILQQISEGRNGAFLAERMDELYPEVDLTAALRAAAATDMRRHDSPRLTELMLKRGMPEGLALAAENLLSKEGHNSMFSMPNEVRGAVRRYVNVEGSDAEVAQWILDNRSKLVWNAQTKMFEEK